MSDEEREMEVEVEESPTAAPTAAPGQTSIRVVEFGKLPVETNVAPGSTITQLVERRVLSNTQDFYVAGRKVEGNYVVQEGDSVVGAPRVVWGS